MLSYKKDNTTQIESQHMNQFSIVSIISIKSQSQDSTIQKKTISNINHHDPPQLPIFGLH